PGRARGIMPGSVVLCWFETAAGLPGGNAAVLMLLRWIHLLAGVMWIGLLYYFNVVNVQFMRGLDTPTRNRILPPLLRRALWWFRWSALVTVLAGIAYWMMIVHADAANSQV